MKVSAFKLAHERAARVAKLSGGSLLVGLSGKDSFATLDVASQHFEHIECFHMYYVRGLRCVELPLETVCKRYNVKLHYVPHYLLCSFLRSAVLRPHIAKLDDTPNLKKEDIERLARKRSGIEWIAYGERLDDSFARRLFWRDAGNGCGGVYEPGKRCALIAEWHTADVVGYNKIKGLPAACTFGDDSRSTDFELTPKVLGWLKTTHPSDYQRVLRIFPAAEALTR